MSIVEEVREALGRVYDPCSQAWQRPLSIVDLGLVREVRVDAAGRAGVTVSPTVPFCMAIAVIMQAIEARVAELPGVSAVTVEVDTGTAWHPGLMTDAGRDALARSRAADGALLPVSG